MEEKFRPEVEIAILLKRQVNSVEERIKNFEKTLTSYRAENRRILEEIDQIKKELESGSQSSSIQKIEVSRSLLDELR